MPVPPHAHGWILDHLLLDMRAGFRELNRKLDEFEKKLSEPPQGFNE